MKIEFSGYHFYLTRNLLLWPGNDFMLSFSLQSIFEKQRESWVRGRCAHAKRERERGRTQKTQKSPTQIVVPDRVAPQNRSTSTQIVVPHRDFAFAPIGFAASIGFARSRLSSNLVAIGLWIFFFLGFICVSGLRNEIIYLFGSWENVRKCEKMWVISRKCVFYGIFNNTTKHQKIFFTTFSEMQQNTLKIFSFPENNISGK